MRGNRLIIVGGAPRSGTTMFQTMMDSHPDVYGGPEFDHLSDIVQLRNRLMAGLKRGRIDQFVDAEQINESTGRLIESLLHPVADRHNAKRLSEKTPMNVLVFPELMTILPDAKFVHIVRDPRAVFVSMSNVAERIEQSGQEKPDFLKSSIAMADYITLCVSCGVAACEGESARAITVRYEDLLTQTAFVMNKVLAFLDLPQDTTVLNPADGEHGGAKMLMGGDDPWAGGRAKFTNPEPENLNKWRDELTQESLDTLRDHFSAIPIYGALGYTFE